MNKSDDDLKAIFDLMHNKLLEISINNKVNIEINERRKRFFDRNQLNSFFYETLVRCIFGAFFKAKTLTNKWVYFKEAFSDFEINEVSEKKLEDLLSYPNIIKNEPKLDACISHAREFKRISSRYGSFGQYLSQDEGNEERLIGKMVRFKFVKDAVARDYLKDIGILDTIKPDSNVLRVFFRLGLIDSENSYNEALHVAERVKQVTSEKLIVIDAVFWMFGGGGDNHVSKPICNKIQPYCNECPVTDYCEFYKSFILSNEND